MKVGASDQRARFQMCRRNNASLINKAKGKAKTYEYAWLDE